jgi:hypothetical protein
MRTTSDTPAKGHQPSLQQRIHSLASPFVARSGSATEAKKLWAASKPREFVIHASPSAFKSKLLLFIVNDSRSAGEEIHVAKVSHLVPNPSRFPNIMGAPSRDGQPM